MTVLPAQRLKTNTTHLTENSSVMEKPNDSTSTGGPPDNPEAETKTTISSDSLEETPPDDAIVPLSRLKLGLIVSGLCLSVFCMALGWKTSAGTAARTC
jgi:hypothetical protein